MEQLRFALLHDGAGLERWHLRCLDELEHVAELVGVVVGKAHAPTHSRLLRSYARRHGAVPVPDRFAQPPAAADAFGAVDFVLRLGRVAVPGGLADAARLGVWRFEHEGEETEAPFLAEVYAGASVTRAALVATAGSEVILEEGVFRTDTRSYAASRHGIEDAIAAWPARACRRLAAGADASPAAAPVAPAQVIRSGSRTIFAARLGLRRSRLAWQRFFRHPQWNVGLLHRPVASLLETGGYGDDEVEWFPLEGRAGFLADPFGLERDGRLQILCEYFDYRTGRGSICALDHSDAGFSSKITDALSLPLHVSYPFVLDLPEGVSCVPETAVAGEIALYRADEPKTWSKVAVLVPDFPGVDPTVFRHEGRWWLTCTRQGPQEDAELWAWHAPELTGPWTPHELNPVKTDVRGARPGGTPFVHHGELYRPAQDCSQAYGGRITLQRVLRLTPAEFLEESAAVVEASSSSRFPLGPHTLTRIGDVVLVDGRRSVFVPAAFRAFLAIWARALASRLRRPS